MSNRSESTNNRMNKFRKNSSFSIDERSYSTRESNDIVSILVDLKSFILDNKDDCIFYLFILVNKIIKKIEKIIKNQKKEKISNINKKNNNLMKEEIIAETKILANEAILKEMEIKLLTSEKEKSKLKKINEKLKKDNENIEERLNSLQIL